MSVLPEFPTPEAVRRGWPQSLIDWFSRLSSLIFAVSKGDIVFEIGNRATETDSNGQLIESDITSTELGYLDGATSNIQTQLNTKFNISTPSPSVAWDDAKVNVGGLKSIGAGVPSFVDINSTGSYGYEFTDESVANNEKRLAFEIQLPHTYEAGSQIRFHIHYMNEADPGADQVIRWQIDYTWTNIGAVLPSATTANYNESVPNGTTAYTHSIAGGGDFYLDGTGMKESSVLMGTMRRNSSNAADTYAGNSAFVVSVDAHIQKEKAGTPNEIPT